MIYFDNAATCKVSRSAADAAYKAMTEEYANPSSLHAFGYGAHKTVESARETVALAAGVTAKEIVFTGGGTASDNLAIRCYLSGKRGRIITSAYEHPAVLECFKALSGQFETVYLKPENGIIMPDALKAALTPDTVLVSVMHVNNETGAINPIKELSATAHASSCAVFHTDAVQGFMKERFLYKYADMASFSAHKLGAPKGCGALYIKDGIRLAPLLYGGGQERGLYCGTENVSSIAGFAAAVNDAHNIEGVKRLNKHLRIALAEMGAVFISPENASPYILTAAFPGYLSENIVHYLSRSEIYVSTGSACSSKKASATYAALGYEKYAKSALRLSFCDENTPEEADIFLAALGDALKNIIRIRG